MVIGNEKNDKIGFKIVLNTLNNITKTNAVLKVSPSVAVCNLNPDKKYPNKITVTTLSNNLINHFIFEKYLNFEINHYTFS